MVTDKSKLWLAWENGEPARTGRRAKLGVAASSGVDWQAVRRATAAFIRRTERFVEANRRVG